MEKCLALEHPAAERSSRIHTPDIERGRDTIGGIMEPRIQYAKTSDGVNVACCDMGKGQPLVYASNVWGISIGTGIMRPRGRRSIAWLLRAGGW